MTGGKGKRKGKGALPSERQIPSLPPVLPGAGMVPECWVSTRKVCERVLAITCHESHSFQMRTIESKAILLLFVFWVVE